MRDHRSLADPFLALLSTQANVSDPGDAEPLEDLLRAALAAGRETWPQLPLPPGEFLAHLARSTPPPGEEDLASFLRRVHAADLYLAAACVAALPGAAEALERHALLPLRLPARLQMTPAFLDEVRQVVRTRLLVSAAAEEPPRIAAYGGRGPLSAWVRAVALRTALNLLRVRAVDVLGGGDDAASFALPAGDDLELDYLRARYRDAFKRAFSEALRALPREPQQLLRLYYVEGLLSAQIAAVLGTSRPTVSRALQAAREQVFQETRARLAAELHLSAGEFASLVGLLRSQLDLSIADCLRAV